LIPTTCSRLHRMAFLLPLVLPALAGAHPGSDAGTHHDAASAFIAGFVHPFTGLDHLAAMVALGLWSGCVARRAWPAPLAFVSMMVAGAIWGVAGITLPGLEPMIAASVLVLGLLAATRLHLPGWAGAALAGGFALFHGNAHGVELIASAQAFMLLGMVVGSAVLIALGLALARGAARRTPWLPRVGGLVLALFGTVLLGALA